MGKAQCGSTEKTSSGTQILPPDVSDSDSIAPRLSDTPVRTAPAPSCRAVHPAKRQDRVPSRQRNEHDPATDPREFPIGRPFRKRSVRHIRAPISHPLRHAEPSAFRSVGRTSPTGSPHEPTDCSLESAIALKTTTYLHESDS